MVEESPRSGEGGITVDGVAVGLVFLVKLLFGEVVNAMSGLEVVMAEGVESMVE
ncbi:hypothetical protein A2U01_0101204, partial [Trifolium medium]|nr:hypothetical protein [Trifolium medium]